MNSLADKYNQPVPRYTSYPTVPFWNELEDASRWISVFRQRFDEENHVDGISIYIHLPFCDSLCTYCGCHKKITTNHSVESEYINALQKEWQLYRGIMNQTPVIRELHLGGGTPTFFCPQILETLVSTIMKDSIRHPKYEFSIEGHPNSTTKAHLTTLAKLGFRRISFGVQDNDPAVQKIINRIQPLENVRMATLNARDAGFTSVNFDLIYGLPLQTVRSIKKTMEDVVVGLKPDRIAYYSYAHVPWTSRAQRLFNEKDLPSPNEKLKIRAEGRKVVEAAGFQEIGMDHFALPTDELFTAMKSGKLHRNFMGYTAHRSRLLVGLGVSSISDTGNAFAQNDKALKPYYKSVENGRLPVRKGYFHEAIDLEMRRCISDIGCNGRTLLNDKYKDVLDKHALPKLAVMASDGLVRITGNEVKVTPEGRKFIRNICSAFDLFLTPADNSRMFSKAI